MDILLVDDSATQRAALAGLLEQEGYTSLKMADSVAQAFQCLVQAGAQSPDLILMDLHMPGINGIEGCRQIKHMDAWRDIPIIMVTSSEATEDLRLAFAAGAIDYITKPPNEVELLARVRSILRLKQETDQRKAREQELRSLNQQLEQVLGNLAQSHKLIQDEKERSDRLLLNILPEPIADQLKASPGVIAERFEAATVLFADIVGFTELSARATPEELITALNDVFSMFDQLADKHGLEKIKTIGDAYMAVGGVPMPRADHAEAVAEMALDIQHNIINLVGGQLQVRVGLHTGPVVAGVIGTKKFSYDLWGDTVNLASRMESSGVPGSIQVSAETYACLRDRFNFEARGTIPVKGKGELATYLLRSRKTQTARAIAPVIRTITRPLSLTHQLRAAAMLLK